MHQFKNLYWKFKNEYNLPVKFLIHNKDNALLLTQNYNIDFELILNGTGSNLIKKLFIVIYGFIILLYKFLFIQKPHIVIGRSNIIFLMVCFVLRIPYIAFHDTDHERIGVVFMKYFADYIITPDCSTISIPKKQTKLKTYKELWYLHPNIFTPNPNVLKEIGLSEHDKFFVVRFVSWEASHDVGQKGLSLEYKRKLIELLKLHGKIIISSEKELPTEFEEYRLKICPTKMHDLLFYATMYIGEGGTMASEAACLGTYSILVNPLIAGTFEELKNKYHLLVQETNIDIIINKINEYFSMPIIPEDYKQNHINFLKDKIDVTEWMIKLIEKELNKN